MIKDALKKKEPLVYACISNDLKNNRLAHSYLLCGDKNPFKKEVAYLLAQSIIEDNNDFACETCNTCLRIKQGNHLDVIYLDGNQGMIKVDDVTNMMEELSKTAAEASNKKVYIINNINNANTSALNKILKFMEEPSNDNTFGIFISDDVDNLLPTIVSRCQRLDFKCTDYSEIKQLYLDNGIDTIDAYLCSELFHEYKNELDDDYLTAKDLVFKTADYLKDINYLPVMFVSEVYPLKNFKEVLECYLNLMIKVLDDSINQSYLGDIEYDGLLDKFNNYALRLMEIYMDGQAILEANQAVDRKLLFDQISYKIISYIRQVKV